MSTQNTSLAIELATEAQKGHILGMWKKRLEDRKLTLNEAQAIITGGNLYVPVMEQSTDLLVDKVRSDMQNTLVRVVRNIRRSRTAMQAIDATGRNKYVNDEVVATMPVGDGSEETELVYFRLGRWVSPEELDKEYESRNLVPDPQAQAADNEADPAFADEHPNGTQWGRKDKVASFLAFNRWSDGRNVYCLRYGHEWYVDWWFAGHRKS